MPSPALTHEILVTLGIALAALVLFVTDRLPMELVGMLVMVALILLGVITPAEGVSGFSNEAVVTIAAMFVLSGALIRTGAVDELGRWISRLSGESGFRLLLVSIAVIIPASAFLNNTPVVIVMVPILLGLARERGIPASRILMPASFASQMGGTLTLIGTSTNLLVAGLVLDLGLPRIGLFQITPPALVFTALGVAYILTLGRRLVPDREGETEVQERYELGEYLSGLEFAEDSPLVGQTLEETGLREEFALDVVAIERDDDRVFLPAASERIRAGDRLVVRGKIADITDTEAEKGLRISGTQPSGWPEEEARQDDDGTAALTELLVPPRSRMVGRSLEDLRFRRRYGVPVVAIRRHGEPVRDSMRTVSLRSGDILLVRGDPGDLERAHRSGDLALLGPMELPVRRREKQGIATAILVAVIVTAALGLTSIMVAALAGMVGVFLTGCLTPRQAYEEVDWQVLVLLATLIPLGVAIQGTGAAALLAVHFLTLTEPLGPVGVLVAFYLLTSLFTELISNAATAVVLTPFAVATAAALDVSALPFVVAIMLAASNSFMTPVGYQTNTFIYGPGGYRFSDFARVGGPLALLFAFASAFVIPFFFPF